MRVYLAAIGLLLAGILQVSALPFLSGGLSVDLVLLLVLAWGIIRGGQEGLLWGLMGGLILDLHSVAPFGMAMVALAAIGGLSGLRGGSLLRGSSYLPPLAAALATICYDGLLMALLALLGREWQWIETLRTVVLPSALLNALMMVPIYWPLYWLNRRLEPEIKW